MRNLPQNLIRDKIYCVNYIEYLGNSGTVEYFYIAVRQEEMPEFKLALTRGNFDAEDYGLILEQGTGSAPQHIRDKMKILYKCEHNKAVNTSDYPGDYMA